MRTLQQENSLPCLKPDGWLVSYADMMTILLAMLIALTALGRD